MSTDYSWKEPAVFAGSDPVSSRDDYLRNRNYAYESEAKKLLYGGQAARPELPFHGSAPQHEVSGTAPFATYGGMTTSTREIQGGQSIKSYEPKKASKEGAEKATNAAFDPDVYRQAIAENANNRAAQRARAWGSGPILEFKDHQQQVDEQRGLGFSRAQQPQQSRAGQDF